MFEVTGFETGRRVRGTLLLAAALAVLVALTVGLFPSIQEAGVDLDAYLENLPPEARRAFVGNVTTITTVEGYLASQLYQFGWVLLLGLYYAYAAASLVAPEVEAGVADLVLAHPITRTRYVVGKYLSLVPAVVGVNVLTLFFVLAAVEAVGESVDAVDLLALHAYSVVYLLACAGLGLLASVAFDAARRAQTVAIGGVFGMFLVDTLTFDTDYEWLGDVAFSRYFDVGELLVEGEVDWGGLALLAVAAVVLVVSSAEVFERRDVA